MKTRNGFVSNSSSSSFVLTLAPPHFVEVDGVVAYCQERYDDEVKWLESYIQKNPEKQGDLAIYQEEVDEYQEEVDEAREALEEAKADPACGRRIRIKVDYGGEEVARELADIMVKCGVVESFGWEDR